MTLVEDENMDESSVVRTLSKNYYIESRFQADNEERVSFPFKAKSAVEMCG